MLAHLIWQWLAGRNERAAAIGANPGGGHKGHVARHWGLWRGLCFGLGFGFGFRGFRHGRLLRLFRVLKQETGRGAHQGGLALVGRAINPALGGAVEVRRFHKRVARQHAGKAKGRLAQAQARAARAYVGRVGQHGVVAPHVMAGAALVRPDGLAYGDARHLEDGFELLQRGRPQHGGGQVAAHLLVQCQGIEGVGREHQQIGAAAGGFADGLAGSGQVGHGCAGVGAPLGAARERLHVGAKRRRIGGQGGGFQLVAQAEYLQGRVDRNAADVQVLRHVQARGLVGLFDQLARNGHVYGVLVHGIDAPFPVDAHLLGGRARRAARVVAPRGIVAQLRQGKAAQGRGQLRKQLHGHQAGLRRARDHQVGEDGVDVKTRLCGGAHEKAAPAVSLGKSGDVAQRLGIVGLGVLVQPVLGGAVHLVIALAARVEAGGVAGGALGKVHDGVAAGHLPLQPGAHLQGRDLRGLAALGKRHVGGRLRQRLQRGHAHGLVARQQAPGLDLGLGKGHKAGLPLGSGLLGIAFDFALRLLRIGAGLLGRLLGRLLAGGQLLVFGAQALQLGLVCFRHG
nr:MAG TPA: hypothetical protein [Caudoviricetes sp.]